METLKYKGYEGTIRFDLEDNCLYGKVEGMAKDLILFEGNTLTELKEDFKNAIDDYIDLCKTKNIKPRKQCSGVFQVRLSPFLHSKAIEYAQINGYSLNGFINESVKKELAHY
jgi:predicted HicB family RNase H-like nuclease